MNEYTERDTEVVTVKKVSDGGTVTWTNGWSFGGVPAEHRPLLIVGAEFLLESVGFSSITGMATIYRTRDGQAVVDRWLWHHTDADREREHAEFVAAMNAEREESWQRNQLDWHQREAKLPSALRRRLDRFRINGGHDFEISGWGYELVISELAVLYAASGQQDTEAIDAYARNEGTSGNQHDCAKALSRILDDDPEHEDAIANAVSGLTPLTGDADYSKAGAR